MAPLKLVLIPCILIICALFTDTRGQKNVIELREDNWTEMLQGEWMVEFYAPWCPACKGLQPIWKEFASWSLNMGIKVGQVDVTTSPGLSGRFMVTALPTIFHVYKGEFRQYKGTRDKDSFIAFIEEKKWQKVEPIPSWKSPNSIQMSIVSSFFKLSQVLRGVHNFLMEEYGLPTWGSYLILAVATIILGALLGLVLVCIIDFVYPPKQTGVTKSGDTDNGHENEKTDKISDDELDDEDIKDDLFDDASQSEGDDVNITKGSEMEAGDKNEPSSPNVKKRKSRKAD